jgi:hypothetical protein
MTELRCPGLDSQPCVMALRVRMSTFVSSKSEQRPLKVCTCRRRYWTTCYQEVNYSPSSAGLTTTTPCLCAAMYPQVGHALERAVPRVKGEGGGGVDICAV